MMNPELSKAIQAAQRSLNVLKSQSQATKQGLKDLSSLIKSGPIKDLLGDQADEISKAMLSGNLKKAEQIRDKLIKSNKEKDASKNKGNKS